VPMPRLRFRLRTQMVLLVIVAVGLVFVDPPRDDEKAMRAAAAKFSEDVGCTSAEHVELRRIDAGWTVRFVYLVDRAEYRIPFPYDVFIDRRYKAKKIDPYAYRSTERRYALFH
jgi:hypothetical protein